MFCQAVPPVHMRGFMQQHRAQPRGVPLTCVPRQDDQRFQDTASERRVDVSNPNLCRFALQKMDRTAGERAAKSAIRPPRGSPGVLDAYSATSVRQMAADPMWFESIRLPFPPGIATK